MKSQDRLASGQTVAGACTACMLFLEHAVTPQQGAKGLNAVIAIRMKRETFVLCPEVASASPSPTCTVSVICVFSPVSQMHVLHAHASAAAKIVNTILQRFYDLWAMACRLIGKSWSVGAFSSGRMLMGSIGSTPYLSSRMLQRSIVTTRETRGRD